jgi:predicted metal-dependent hydrolase
LDRPPLEGVSLAPTFADVPLPFSAAERPGPTAAPELPAYTVRVSQRARHVRLTVTPRDGLVVVVPKRWRGNPAEIVALKREWAQRALARVAEDHALHAAGADALLPDRVELRLAGEIWPVEYRATAAGEGSGRAQARASGSAIVVAGDVADAEACLAALSRWLDRTSRELLLPMLAEVADEAGVTYASARIRHQRTRWGSCSARTTISLNRSLVFLPPHLVRALMLHELAHVAVMDHSERFWRHLSTLDPSYPEHRAALRDAARFVPAWADA